VAGSSFAKIVLIIEAVLANFWLDNSIEPGRLVKNSPVKNKKTPQMKVFFY
jgi:hypothetical protein